MGRSLVYSRPPRRGLETAADRATANLPLETDRESPGCGMCRVDPLFWITWTTTKASLFMTNVLGFGMQVAIPAAMPDYFERFEARFYRELSEAVEIWGKSVTALAQWEDEHLLDRQTPEDLSAHRRTVERLTRFGTFLSKAMDYPDFPHRALRENVAATIQTLQDKIPIWHGTMPKAQAEAILKAAFPE
jgi:hypothetical protein